MTTEETHELSPEECRLVLPMTQSALDAAEARVLKAQRYAQWLRNRLTKLKEKACQEEETQ